jgi:hypothetical protein
MAKFETGKTYYTRSICDSDCIIQVTVTARTAKTVTTDKGKRLKVHERDGVEFVMPWGRYSMSPAVPANRVM